MARPMRLQKQANGLRDQATHGRTSNENEHRIGGASHGGFMAAWAIGQTDRFKAAMMAAGISDWGMLVAIGEWGTLEAELSGSCAGRAPARTPTTK